MPPRKASSRMASTRGKRTKATGSSYRGKNNNSSSSSSSKPTSENPPSSANTDDSLAKLGSQMTGLRVHSQSAATTSSFSSPTKADRRKFVDDVEPPMGLSEDQIAPLLYNFDLESTYSLCLRELLRRCKLAWMGHTDLWIFGNQPHQPNCALLGFRVHWQPNNRRVEQPALRASNVSHAMYENYRLRPFWVIMVVMPIWH